MAKFLDIKLPEDWKLNSRGYGLNKAGFRDLPKDELIEKLWETIPNKSWKFVFGLMATYGLRNHEVFFCDLTSLTNFILDEINIATKLGYLAPEEIITFLKSLNNRKNHIVLTGRGASDSIINYADLVTEMKLIRHPFKEQGIKAQKCVEF